MITIDMAKCSGCRRCEVHCSFFRSGKIGRSGARIKVVKIEDQGLDFPVVCRQCRERYCKHCPEKALTIGALGQVIVSPTSCTSCGACENLCPIGAIELFEGLPYVCDLCDGEPRCVQACTPGAIAFDPKSAEHISLKEFKKEKRSLNPEEKRTQFTLAMSKTLREQWLRQRRG